LNVREDPYQTRNLAEEQPEVTARLDHYMTEWLHAQSAKPNAIPDPMQVVLREWKERGK